MISPCWATSCSGVQNKHRERKIKTSSCFTLGCWWIVPDLQGQDYILIFKGSVSHIFRLLPAVIPYCSDMGGGQWTRSPTTLSHCLLNCDLLGLLKSRKACCNILSHKLWITGPHGLGSFNHTTWPTPREHVTTSCNVPIQQLGLPSKNETRNFTSHLKYQVDAKTDCLDFVVWTVSREGSRGGIMNSKLCKLLYTG